MNNEKLAKQIKENLEAAKALLQQYQAQADGGQKLINSLLEGVKEEHRGEAEFLKVKVNMIMQKAQKGDSSYLEDLAKLNEKYKKE